MWAISQLTKHCGDNGNSNKVAGVHLEGTRDYGPNEGGDCNLSEGEGAWVTYPTTTWEYVIKSCLTRRNDCNV